jgi:hypothetical protein
MKTLLAHLVQFALIYGIKDKEKFHAYATEWLKSYPMEVTLRDQIIEFIYDFIASFSIRLQQTQIVENGVRQGVDSLKTQMEELNEKLERFLQKMPMGNI